jgi:hypothetical protein
MTTDTKDARIRAEVREIEKAAAVLACIQCTAEYDNEVEADLADAVSVVQDIITRIAARIDEALSTDGKTVTDAPPA